MYPIITKYDLEFIKDLNNRIYSGNTMKSMANPVEIEKFKSIKLKLKKLAISLKSIYDSNFGEFEVSVSTGNPIAYGGTRLNRVWSGLFKGGTNKQYAAQISFVVNTDMCCLDVGFFFGRASSHSLKPKERKEQEDRLKFLGESLSKKINSEAELTKRYESLFDYGFNAYSKGKLLSSDQWLNRVKEDPSNSHLVYRLFPDDGGLIETSTIRLYVSMISFLMNLIPQSGSFDTINVVRPLTPEERAKQAERRALIGYKGELLVFQREEEKLRSLQIDPIEFLSHVSLKSDHYGYDVLSVDSHKDVMYIEVKTTTRTKSDPYSSKFFMSLNEFDFYKSNTKHFYLYRVYGIEGDSPEIEVINLEEMDVRPDGYIVEKIINKRQN